MRHKTCKMQHTTCRMQHAGCDLQLAGCNMQHAAYDTQDATSSMQHTTCNMQEATCNMQEATCNMQDATSSMRHTTYNMLHTTRSMQHTTRNIQHTTCCIRHAAHQGAIQWGAATATAFVQRRSLRRRPERPRQRCFRLARRPSRSPPAAALHCVVPVAQPCARRLQVECASVRLHHEASGRTLRLEDRLNAANTSVRIYPCPTRHGIPAAPRHATAAALSQWWHVGSRKGARCGAAMAVL